MGYMTDGLTFNALREANCLRLPQFKNKHGQLAHSKADGSDWSPAQWFQATLGELGEYAMVRFDYEHGVIGTAEFQEAAPKELADVVTYLDIMSRRAFDKVQLPQNQHMDAPQTLMWIIGQLGIYANARKKLDRGDMTLGEFRSVKLSALDEAMTSMKELMADTCAMPCPVVEVHSDGVNLGAATMDKFNEVSVRVGSTVRLAADGVYLESR